VKNIIVYGWILVCGWALADPNSIATEYDKPGKWSVEKQHLEWTDGQRARRIPVTLYMPKGDGPFPVILFSHGLGGSRDGYAYLGNHWASWGYCCIHLQHEGSDSAVWQDKQPANAWRDMKKAANAQNAQQRVLDMQFAIEMLKQLNQQQPCTGKLDTQRIGIAGHSFGAQTTLAMVGASRKSKVSVDSRIKAAIPMSAPVIRGPLGLVRQNIYEDVAVPCLHMTGTLDDSPIGGTKAADRRFPYDCIGKADQYLITFNGGNHMIFPGPSARAVSTPPNELFWKLILGSTTAFWQTYLNGDTQAGAWLQKGSLKDYLGSSASLEEKILPAANAKTNPVPVPKPDGPNG
jgi:predicted dienelactone hydrolase